MDKFIAVFLGGLILVAAAHADPFSNEDFACTGACRVHDGVPAAAKHNTLASGKQPSKALATARAAR